MLSAFLVLRTCATTTTVVAAEPGGARTGSGSTVPLGYSVLDLARLA